MGMLNIFSGWFSSFATLFILPIVLLIGILWLCKMYNFTILPDDFRGKKPKKFKLPKLSRKERNNAFKWEAEDSSDSESEED